MNTIKINNCNKHILQNMLIIWCWDHLGAYLFDCSYFGASLQKTAKSCIANHISVTQFYVNVLHSDREKALLASVFQQFSYTYILLHYGVLKRSEKVKSQINRNFIHTFIWFFFWFKIVLMKTVHRKVWMSHINSELALGKDKLLLKFSNVISQQREHYKPNLWY